MKMWIDLILDGDVGVGAKFVFNHPLVEVGLDGGFKEPYPTIYVFVPVFGTSEFGESFTEIVSPVFYHVVDNLYRVDFVTAARYGEHPDVSVTVVVEAGG